MRPDQELPPLGVYGAVADHLARAIPGGPDVDISRLISGPDNPEVALEDESQHLFGYSESRGRYLVSDGRDGASYTPPFLYENLLSTPGLTRRTGRPVPRIGHVPKEGSSTLISEWLEDTYNYVSEDTDLQFEDVVPSEMEHYIQFVEHDMPACLDADSWIGQMLLGTAVYSLEDASEIGYFRPYEAWMGDHNGLLDHIYPGSCFRNKSVCWGRKTEPGCFVFLPKSDLESVYPSEMVRRPPYESVKRHLLALEGTLIHLSRRIVRAVVKCIMLKITHEHAETGKPVLRRDQVGPMVREILGEKWFDLPFDNKGVVQAWFEWDVSRVVGHSIPVRSVFITPDL